VRADLICPDRAAVLENARTRSSQLPEVGAVELVAAGDHVVLSVRAPTVGMPLADGAPMRGQASIVFTLRDGLITAMQDYTSRREALAAAGAEPAVWD
jgi:ketosteroid isomerase-like protein